MILLTSTSDLIQVITGSAGTVNVHTSWVDNASGTITPGRTNTATISTAATTTVVASPAASTQRNVKFLSVFNNHVSVSNLVTIQHTDGTNVEVLWKGTLAPGESVSGDDEGWQVLDANGVPKITRSQLPTSSGNSSSPTGNVSTTEKAMGLGGTAGFTITPTSTGRVLVIIAGMALNSTAAGDGTTIQLRYGTGTAPANGATTGLGTALGVSQKFIASTTAGKQGFAINAVLSGMTVGTQYWFDLSVIAVTGGGASVQDVNISLVEV